MDFNNDEPQAAVIVIVAFTGLLGFIQPRKAWRWALIVGLGVPIVYLLATALGYHAKSIGEPGWYASLIALIPAFISTYCGVLLRKARVADTSAALFGRDPTLQAAAVRALAQRDAPLAAGSGPGGGRCTWLFPATSENDCVES